MPGERHCHVTELQIGVDGTPRPEPAARRSLTRLESTRRLPPRLMARSTPSDGGTRSIPRCRTSQSSSTARRRPAARAIHCAAHHGAGLRIQCPHAAPEGGRAPALYPVCTTIRADGVYVIRRGRPADGRPAGRQSGRDRHSASAISSGKTPACTASPSTASRRRPKPSLRTNMSDRGRCSSTSRPIRPTGSRD